MLHKYDVVIVGLNAASSILLLKKFLNSNNDILIITSLKDEDVQLCGLSLVDYLPHMLLWGRDLSNLAILRLAHIDSRPNVHLVKVNDLSQVEISFENSKPCARLGDQVVVAGRVIVCSEYRPEEVHKLLESIECAVRAESTTITGSDVFKVVEIALLLASHGVKTCIDSKIDVRQYFEREIVDLFLSSSVATCANPLEICLDLRVSKPTVEKVQRKREIIVLGHGFMMTDRSSGIRYVCTRDIDLLVRSTVQILNSCSGEVSLPYVNAIFTENVSVVQLGLPRVSLQGKYRDLSSTRVCKDKHDGRVCVRLISWKGKLLSMQVTCIGKSVAELAEYYLDLGLHLLAPDVRYVPLFRIQDVIRGYSAPEPLGTCLLNVLE